MEVISYEVKAPRKSDPPYNVTISLEKDIEWEDEPGYWFQITQPYLRVKAHRWVDHSGPYFSQELCEKAAKERIIVDTGAQ